MVGGDADFVIWRPDDTFTVCSRPGFLLQCPDLSLTNNFSIFPKIAPDGIYLKNKITPYEGKTMYGVVQKTVLRGNVVYENGKGFMAKPVGEFIL